jgi:hypothetical protein
MNPGCANWSTASSACERTARATAPPCSAAASACLTAPCAAGATAVAAPSPSGVNLGLPNTPRCPWPTSGHGSRTSTTRPNAPAAPGRLIRAFRQSLSRRRVRSFIARLRRRQLRRLREAKLHVTWHLPNLAWAIDALHLQTSPADPGVVVVLARDLASHFHFEPLVLKAESAMHNLDWLRRLCSRHGAPLLLKRDNGAPFNAAILDGFLAAKIILPLNSPIRRPSYNGAVEHAVGSFKRAVLAALPPDQPVPEIPKLLPLVRAVIHLHNSRPRRSLTGLTPAQAYFHHCPRPWSRARRQQIFDWIFAHARSMVETQWEMSDHHLRAAAWRRSVVAWLRCQHLITVSPKPQPSPLFKPQIRS